MNKLQHLLLHNSPIYNIFGSKSSKDYDIIISVDNIPSVQECHNIVYDHNCALFEIYKDKEINSNLAQIENGIVVRCFKGTPDELNNAVLETYSLHTQNHSCLVGRRLSRNVDLKIARYLRGCLTYLSRSEFRTEIKSLLREGTIEEQCRFLAGVDISDRNLYVNKGGIEDIFKCLAFQMGQVAGLLDFWRFSDSIIELYTKEDIIDYWEDLREYLERRPSTNYIDAANQEILRQIMYCHSPKLLVENEASLMKKAGYLQ